MRTALTLLAIARADFLERIRRYSFLVTLLFSVFLGYAAATGSITMRISNSRGLYTSAWIGTAIALIAGCFISLAGFYVVKNSVDRDRVTGVGQILAATPMSKTAYATGKWLSNLAVLMTQLCVLAMGAVVMFWFVGEEPHLNLWHLLSPLMLLTIPMLALTAAFAVAFEMVPGLNGGFGNVVWFFLYTLILALPSLTRVERIDPLGLRTVINSLRPMARQAIPNYTESFSLGINDAAIKVARGLRWQGIAWDFEGVVVRFGWIAIGFGLVLMATLLFDRFDRGPAPGKREKVQTAVMSPAGLPHAERHWSASLEKRYEFSFTAMFAAELRLALQGYRWWWYGVAAGLVVGQLATPLETARGPLLAIAWMWPVLIWSGMGVREARYGTELLIASSARSLWRQFPACWMAGVAVTALCGGGALVRLAVAKDLPGLTSWTAAVLLIPALALSLGVWTRSSRAFEAVFTVLWYAGPLSHLRGLDFTGSANGTDTLRFAGVYVVLAAVLLAGAIPGRMRQIIST